jgi:hypothetical protein
MLIKIKYFINLLYIIYNMYYIRRMKLSASNCRDCDAKLLGRSDKKFCNDYCRNTYNGKRNRDVSNSVRNINNILRKNRRILLQFAQNNILVCSKTELINLGFRMDYCTRFYTDQEGKNHKFYYDILISESNATIVIHLSEANPPFTFQSKVV